MVYSQVMDISFFDKIVPNSNQVDCTVKTAADMGDYDFFIAAGVMWMPVCFAFSRF
jgi:hypothetical protein